MFAACEAGTRHGHYSGYSLFDHHLRTLERASLLSRVECGWNAFCPTLPNISFSIKYLRLGWNGWNRNHTVFYFTDIFSESWANKPTERLSLLKYIASGSHLIYKVLFPHEYTSTMPRTMVQTRLALQHLVSSHYFTRFFLMIPTNLRRMADLGWCVCT